MPENNDNSNDENERISPTEDSHIYSIMEIIRINELEPTPDHLNEKKNQDDHIADNDKIWIYKKGKLL